jgi:hypothetical protein
MLFFPQEFHQLQQLLIASLFWLKFSDYFKQIKNFQSILDKKQWPRCAHEWVF